MAQGTDGFVRNIGIFFRCMELLRTVDAEIQAQQVGTFLLVAMSGEMPMKNLSEMLDVAQSTCSRNVAALGKRHRTGRSGLDLLESYTDPSDWRRKLVRLTPKGRRIAEQLALLISTAAPDVKEKANAQG